MTFGMVGTAVVLVGGLIVVGLLTRDRRYRGSHGQAPGFEPTSEVFVDPTSGRRVRVYVNPATGQRQYRDEPEAPPDV